MQDRFCGKTWIFWAQLIVCGALATLSLSLGALFWTGAMKDARGAVRPETGPPLVIVGCCLMVVAMLAIFNILARVAPIIRCYRDGIECNLIGATSLDGVPLVPGLVRVAWTILSLQGFRSQHVRIPWTQFVGARVGGIPMAYVLTINGTATNLKTGRATGWIAFMQAALRDDPQQVADVLNRLGETPAQRERLPRW